MANSPNCFPLVDGRGRNRQKSLTRCGSFAVFGLYVANDLGQSSARLAACFLYRGSDGLIPINFQCFGQLAFTSSV
ncbi:hypothetical protein RRG08_036624 [Elysia crispata]|uniref:Uncharacterized protein n=1 Tax=Elysia crispata TaxID=231223 RepID=A0AAE1A358_9GAST|nr:hypothetical protein RRG08_036624 [Elysia crispata]